jgi:hypothetical protein
MADSASYLLVLRIRVLRIRNKIVKANVGQAGALECGERDKTVLRAKFQKLIASGKQAFNKASMPPFEKGLTCAEHTFAVWDASRSIAESGYAGNKYLEPRKERARRPSKNATPRWKIQKISFVCSRT